MERHFKNFKFLQIFSFVILFGMMVFAVIITRNVNQEFKIREVAGLMQGYKYSILSFNNIYNGLPGDLDKATLYWKEETSDGNGDKEILHDDKEGVLAWQHLQLAQLVDYPYSLSGKWQVGKPKWLIENYNVPLEKKHSGIFYINFNEIDEYNYIGFAGVPKDKGISAEAILTPENTMKLDLMMDDGYPETGVLKAIRNSTSSCFLSGEYKEESELVECAVDFRI